ncbi:MAG: YhdP family protein [Burkholderiales bacterium]
MPLVSFLPSASSLGSWLRRVVRALIALTLLGASILLTAWLTLQWGILPRIEYWRPDIEAWASRWVGTPVHIASIHVEGGLWAPVLTVRDLRFIDASGREALQLQQVRAVLAPRSLLPRSLTHWAPRFEQLVIDQPNVVVRRDPQGRFWVAGLQVNSGAAGDDTRAADWLFSQGEVALRHGELRWIDEQRGAPELVLTDVEVVLRNRFTRHRLRIDATPPPAWGERFTVQGDLRHPLLAVTGLQRPGDWRLWRGEIHAALPLADVHALSRYLTLPFELNEGRLALQAWLQIDHAAVIGGAASIGLREVSARLAKDLEPLSLTSLSARVEVQRQHESTFGKTEAARLSLHDLTFTTGDGVQWPTSDVSLSLQRLADGTVRSGSAEASVLDLPVMAELAARLPLSRPLRTLIDQARPQGRINDAKLRWQGSPDAPTSYWTSGQAQGLHLAGAPPSGDPDGHTPGRPGIRNADIAFEFTERGGQAHIAMRNGALEFPGVFEEPLLPLTTLAGDVRWRITPQSGRRPDLLVELPDMRFGNDDTQGQLQGSWRSGEDKGTARANAYLPGLLDLTARLGQARAERVHRYLPLGIPAQVRHYVRDAVRAGEAGNVVARVRGPLRDFPFARSGSGEFTLRADVRQGELAYVPEPAGHWPVFTQVSAQLLFERQSLRIQQGSAQLGHLGSGAFALSQIDGRIANFADAPALHVEGRGRGPLTDALLYLRESPVGALLDHALDPTTGSGNTDLTLALDIPLHEAGKTHVRGTVDLGGNTVQLRPDVPVLSDVHAQVAFSTDSFSLRNGSARALGGGLTFDGGQQRDGALRFTAQGTASAEGLRRTPELPLLPALAGHLTGQAPYRLQLGFLPGGRTEVAVTSSLQGIGTRLPMPLAKPEAQAWPLKVSLQPLPQASPSAAARELLRVELANGNGPLLDVQYLREPGGDGNARVLRGLIALGAGSTGGAASLADGSGSGVQAQVVLPQLSIDAWTDWWDASYPPAQAGAANSAATAGTPAASDVEPYLPNRATLRTAQLRVKSRQLSNVAATLSRERTADGPRNVTDWRADVQADQLAGRIEFREGSGSTDGRVRARLSRLNVPDEQASVALETALESAPQRLPALDVVVDAFELRGKQLGKLEVQAVNRGDGSNASPREWRLSKLALTLPEARFNATGNWASTGASTAQGPRRTALTFTLDLEDGGALLNRFGLPGTVRHGTGQLRGQLGWRGSPLALDWPSLSGALQLDVNKGQFLRADPGIARLLGVLSLQSLPRRLLLDFSDVTQQGFSFDHIDGDVTIDRGIASTRNLRIRGVQATILTEGSADLARETQDLHIWVVPDINAGAASLAYAAINPVIGLSTLIGQLFLRKSLAEAATREFRVTGRWDAPQVIQLGSAESRGTPSEPQPARPAEAPSVPASGP